MDDELLQEIEHVKHLLDSTARSCLRMIETRNLTPAQYKNLSKWMYGCVNQRYTIGQRIARHGSGELDKLLRFIAKACNVMLTVESSFLPSEEDADEGESE